MKICLAMTSLYRDSWYCLAFLQMDKILWQRDILTTTVYLIWNRARSSECMLHASSIRHIQRQIKFGGVAVSQTVTLSSDCDLVTKSPLFGIQNFFHKVSKQHHSTWVENLVHILCEMVFGTERESLLFLVFHFPHCHSEKTARKKNYALERVRW